MGWQDGCFPAPLIFLLPDTQNLPVREPGLAKSEAPATFVSPLLLFSSRAAFQGCLSKSILLTFPFLLFPCLCHLRGRKSSNRFSFSISCVGSCVSGCAWQPLGPSWMCACPDRLRSTLQSARTVPGALQPLLFYREKRVKENALAFSVRSRSFSFPVVQSRRAKLGK